MRLFELIYSDTFMRDLNSLDPSLKERLKKLISKLLQNPLRFKHLEGYPNIYRLRFAQFRLIYKVEGNKIILLFVRKRDIVYRIL